MASQDPPRSSSTARACAPSPASSTMPAAPVRCLCSSARSGTRRRCQRNTQASLQAHLQHRIRGRKPFQSTSWRRHRPADPRGGVLRHPASERPQARAFGSSALHPSALARCVAHCASQALAPGRRGAGSRDRRSPCKAHTTFWSNPRHKAPTCRRSSCCRTHRQRGFSGCAARAGHNGRRGWRGRRTRRLRSACCAAAIASTSARPKLARHVAAEAIGGPDCAVAAALAAARRACGVASSALTASPCALLPPGGLL